ncbi:MAG: sigma-70 family RNA polymerase sigma factor [Anaerolineae bacterium]|nr:MAG: sigma-70 family RNA polymerase sigma factor [Anaerolineae bacterium]
MPTASLQMHADGLRKLDPETITAIHEKYYPVLYRYARYRLGDAMMAEDVASETLMRLMDAVAKGRMPNTSLSGWLMGTAANLVNQHYRKKYRRKMVALEDQPEDFLPASDEHAPHFQAERRDQMAIIRQAMQYLTPEQQHVLALRFGSELSLKETAEIMGKKVNAIKALQFRALASLKKHYQQAIATQTDSGV